MTDIDDLVLKHLEEIGVINIKIENNEKFYKLTEEFKKLVNKGLEIPDIQGAPDPLISAIMLSYLYCVGGVVYAYEIQKTVSTIHSIYLLTETKKNEVS